MFYRCQKCKNTWQHPISKCPLCFSEPEPMLSEKIKVIGISKVNIPTPLHPKIPYFVLLLEDENGNKWTQKSKKEYKIGDGFEIKENNDKNTVAVWKAKYNLPEEIETIIKTLGGVKIGTETKILILPALSSPKHPYFRDNTSPEFLESLIDFLFKKGAVNKNVKVAGQSFNEIPIGASAQKSGLLAICQDKKVNVLDIAQTKFRKIEKNGFTFEVSEELFENTLIINVPILKLDSKLGIKAALENAIKFAKKEQYLGLKYLYDEESLMINLNNVLPPFLTLAEGVYTQKTNGFNVFSGILLASFNPFNLDRVFAEIAMIKNLPEYLKNNKIENIPIAGREIEEVQFNIAEYG